MWRCGDYIGDVATIVEISEYTRDVVKVDITTCEVIR